MAMQPGGSIVEIPPQSLVWSEPQEWRCSSSWDREELDEAHKKFLDELPAKAGFYIFTDSQLLLPGKVLYIGATQNLKSRVAQYDIKTPVGRTRMAGIHRAMMEIRNRQKKTGNKLFVRWTLFPHLKMERNLVSWLVPQLNEYLTNEVAPTWGFPRGWPNRS